MPGIKTLHTEQPGGRSCAVPSDSFHMGDTAAAVPTLTAATVAFASREVQPVPHSVYHSVCTPLAAAPSWSLLHALTPGCLLSLLKGVSG